MSVIKLSNYGLNLTGRPFSVQTYLRIKDEFSSPYELDLQGVYFVGSSFADEVIAKLAMENGGVIKIYHSSRVIDRCLDEVAKEFGFKIERE